MVKHKKIIALLLVLSSIVGLSSVALAQTAVTQSFNTDVPIENGMIVELDTNDPSKVEPATQKSLDKIHGIVVAPNDAPVSLSNNGTTQQVYVADFGQYNVLVSDQNGAIQKGDYINMSSLAGVGMKSDDAQNIVVGKALSDFDGGSNTQGSVALKNSAGHKVTVHLGYVQVDISIAHNPLLTNTEANLPGFLEKASQSIANKPVSTGRVYIGIAVLFAATVLAGSVLYAGVRSGMIAMGRNPLARKSIMRNLFQVILTSFIVFLVGIFAVYLLLKL